MLPLLRTLPTRLGLAALALSLLTVPGCDKGDGASNAPDTSDVLADKDDGKTRLKYAKGGFTLVATKYEVEQNVSGGQTGTLKMAGVGTVVVEAAGDGKLRVTSTTDEMTSYDATGAFKPDPKEGEEPKDPKEEYKGAQSWSIIDLLGETDSEASKALPENVKRREEIKAAREGQSDEEAALAIPPGSFIDLPGLPLTALELGKEVTMPSAEEEQDLFGGQKVLMEVDRAYTLKSLEGNVATVDFEIAASGAQEIEGQNGPVFFAFDTEVTGTLGFDIEKGIPLSIENESLTELSFGDRTFESNSSLAAAFEIK